MADTAMTMAPAPSLIGTIARKELTEIMRDGRFKWTAIIMVVLLLTALLTGWQRFAAYREMQEHAQETSNEQFAGQGPKHPHSGAHFGTWALKKAGGLSFFDSGVSNYTGNLIWIVAHNQNAAIARPANDLSAVARFGDLDGATILQVLMPLLIIFLGFTSLAGERERGTLRQLVAMGVSRSDILWGKAFGVGGAVLLVVAPCVLLGVGALAIVGVPDTVDAFGARAFVMVLVYAAYALTLLFLTLAVSARAPTARSALIILIGFWIFSAFLMPKAGVEISKAAYPSPPVGEFMASMLVDQVKGLGGDPPQKRLDDWKQGLLAKYGVSRIADLPVGWIGLLLQKLEDMNADVFDYHYGNLRATYTAQRRVQDTFGLIDPILPLTSISTGLAGTDLLHNNRFTIAAEDYRRMMIKRVDDYLTNEAVADNKVEENVRKAAFVTPPGFFKTITPFSYRPPTFAEVMTEYRWSFVLLGAWLLVTGWAAVRAIHRMDPGTR